MIINVADNTHTDMTKVDARKHSREELRIRRMQVIQLLDNGVPVMQIVQRTGLSWSAVNAAIKRHQNTAESSLMPEKRGRKPGTGTKLTSEHESELYRVISTKQPWQLGFRSLYRNTRVSLWDRDLLNQLIKKKYEVSLSYGSVSNLLKRWGFPSTNSKKRPYERCSKHIQDWLDINFASILERVQSENAEIYWVSKKSLGSISNETLTTNSEKLRSIIYVINNQGKVHWRIIKGRFTPLKQIKLLNALVTQSKRKIFLIRDDRKLLGNVDVRSWLRNEEKRIELFPPPSWVPAETNVVKA